MNSMFSFCVIFFLVLDYDEMNCTLISRVFYNVSKVHVLAICNNYELMWE
jgi:hypothetical protein